ncbi:MAG: hemerythrin domain-containing protein [Endomicrobia bacterium]|nr:hemerythrin domain-containing protein [Endomicrobiia bacterium]
MNYYDSAIKEVIRKFPKVGELLAAYGVDCVTCSVGTCLLKDVLDIHNFPQDKKKTIMSQIDRIIGGEDVDISAVKTAAKESRTAAFCAPLQQLVDEHKNILRLLDLAQYIGDKKQIDGVSAEIARKVIFYVKNYADKYHHAKEENILFKKAGSNTDMIKAMISEHETARNFIRRASEGLESGNQEQIKQALLGYVNLLREHIKKEDKILYPWFEKTLSDGQKTEMEKEFETVDRSFDKNISGDLLKFLDENYS